MAHYRPYTGCYGLLWPKIKVCWCSATLHLPVYYLFIACWHLSLARMWVLLIVYPIFSLLTSLLLCICLPGCECSSLFASFIVYWPLHCFISPCQHVSALPHFPSSLPANYSLPISVCQFVSVTFVHPVCCLMTSVFAYQDVSATPWVIRKIQIFLKST